MTRKEGRNEDEVSVLSKFIRKDGKDSSKGLAATDLDFVLEEFKTGRVMYIEEKLKMAKVQKGQRLTFKMMDSMARFATENGYIYNDLSYKYKGLFVVQFVGCDIDSGIFINGERKTKEELKHFVSFVSGYAPLVKPIDFANPEQYYINGVFEDE